MNDDFLICPEHGGTIRTKNCKFCKHIYYLRNKVISKERGRIWRKKHVERCREYWRQWYKRHIVEARLDSIRKSAIWRINNPEKYEARLKRKKYPKALEQLREWRKNNPEKVRAQRKRHHERSKLDFQNALNHNMSSRLRLSLIKSNIDKAGRRWELLVGYTVHDLKKHLESLFTEGMTWKNYGQWHVDHIWPLSRLYIDGVDDPTFKFAWSLSNLQPLWAKDNFKKNNKIKAAA